MQLYDRGIRRRLAPMLGGDQRRLELAYSLMFTLPGTPVIRYGDELGMGDDLTLPERACARTAMQWSNEPHGGFTKNAKPRTPVIDHDHTVTNTLMPRSSGAIRLNVESDRAHYWNGKEVPEIDGRFTVLNARDPAVLAHDWRNNSVLFLHTTNNRVKFSGSGHE